MNKHFTYASWSQVTLCNNRTKYDNCFLYHPCYECTIPPSDIEETIEDIQTYYANSADPDETARFEPFHLDLHCLPVSVWFYTVTTIWGFEAVDTGSPLYTDTRYNDKIRYNVNLTVTKPSLKR